MEVWKEIKGYEGLYEISSFGNVRGLKRNKLRKLYTDEKGYVNVTLWKNNVQRKYSVHRLVACAFIENNDNKSTVDHINRIKTDNSVDNLRWATHKEQLENKRPSSLIVKVKAVDVATGEYNTYSSIKECANNLNIDSGNISKCIKNIRKQSNGYRFYRIEDD